MSSRTLPRHWTPLKEWKNEDFHERPEVVQACIDQYGITEEEARAALREDHDRSRYYINDLYQVQVQPTGREGRMLHINIRRRDGGMFKDWRHFQQIKNEIAGPEREAIEIYPAESRKVDTTNKWHLWVFPEGMRVELGWGERDVQYEENRGVPGIRQRPL